MIPDSLARRHAHQWLVRLGEDLATERRYHDSDDAYARILARQVGRSYGLARLWLEHAETVEELRSVRRALR